MITSTGNGQIKNIIQLNQKAKARREQGLFVAEGIKMFLEAPLEWIEKVYIAESLKDSQQIVSKMARVPCEIVADSVFAQMSDTKTPQGVMCLLKQPGYTLEEIIPETGEPLILVLEDLQDPGNMGTILRTAEGAGVKGILCSKNTVDIFNPKVIRSTMGSVYRMPFFYTEDLEAAVKELKQRGIRTYAAHLKGEKRCDQESYCKGSAFFIGNEGKGLSPRLTSLADGLIRIPMAGQVESLNAALAAGILMYEAARQREFRQGGCSGWNM